MRRLLLLLLVLAHPAAVSAQDSEAPTKNPDAATYARPSAAIERALATDKNYVELRYANTSGTAFLVPHVNELSTLDLMSRQTYRLGELELRPATDRLWHLDTYGIDGFRFYRLDDRRFVDVELPAGTFASDFTWSPSGDRVAFLAHLPRHTQIWTANARTGETRSLSSARVLATIATSARGQGTGASSMVQWTPDGSVITLMVPEGRGLEPSRNPVPDGPVVRRTRDKPMSTRTYPNLLEDAHDEALFEHFTTSQITRFAPDGSRHTIGEPGMYESIKLSPDGAHLIATRIEPPFSFRTSYRGFPRRTVIINVASGEEVELEYRALREGGGGNGNGGRRGFDWIPDGSGLVFMHRAERDEDNPDAERPDRIIRSQPPFDLDNGEIVATSLDPIRGPRFSLDGRKVFAPVTKDGETAIAWWDLDADEPERQIVLDFGKRDDPLTHPGDPVERRMSNGLGYLVVSSDGGSMYLQGSGYSESFAPQPFIDRVSLSDGSTDRVFEGAADSYERPLLVMDADASRLIVSRESQTDYPDSFLKEGDRWTNLTNNVDPFPEITAAKRVDFEFERRDGLKVQGRVSLPVAYQEGDTVPAIFWTYPREYTTAEGYENAAVRSRNHNAFTHMSWLRWSNLWLLEGYALVYPDIPIVGENYNDTYIGNLVDAMYGAIRAVDGLDIVDIDRIGHGGHSYGAFATANILANAPFFKAGIAGDGAYNRSLTPAGFQAERRSIWEAPHTYLEMSPFFKADQIDTPMLLYHGGDDNNSGTFPVQSRRMIHALTEHGKTAVLYEYPYESHTPRAIENKLDMWARFIDWFDQYVKGEAAEGDAAAETGG